MNWRSDKSLNPIHKGINPFTLILILVVLVVCSLSVAIVCFLILGSTATYNTTDYKLGGGIVGFIVTFGSLLQAYLSLNKQYMKNEHERLQDKVANLENKLWRQFPSPPDYKRSIIEDYNVVFHIPKKWKLGYSVFMTILAPAQIKQTGFNDNIVFDRRPADDFYDLTLKGIYNAKMTKINEKYHGIKNQDFENEIAKLKETNSNEENLSKEEKINQIPNLILELFNIKKFFDGERSDTAIFGAPECIEVDGHPALKYQMRNPKHSNLINIVTNIIVNIDEGYVYSITLTSSFDTVSANSTIYNKIISSLKFVESF